MHISHIAIWTQQLEKLKDFYITYFGGKSNDKYVNPIKGFESYFISFDRDTSALEIMYRKDVTTQNIDCIGLTHFAFSLGSKEGVIELTERLRKGGYAIAGEPRTTGDGYFESVVLDPDGNRVEITD